MDVSIVIPARNEAGSLVGLLPKLVSACPGAEVIVVNDGSTDHTIEVCAKHPVSIVSHPYPKGNGAAIKSGARAARGRVIIFMDADGQHDPDDIPRLLAKLDEGYDMVVGARQRGSQANVGRGLANGVYNGLATYMTNHRIEDLTSGFRAVRADLFREFLYLLPNGFSYPTTITMAFFRAGYAVAYEPIHAARRQGTSHLRPLKDGVRFLLIIFKIGTLYAPLKLFAPLALAFFLIGTGWYGYTFATIGRFTNMSALMLTTSFIVFSMGLISEQITQLMYRPDSSRQSDPG
ncbi:glycosyltransferase family 2 protein [Pseudothauera rhizosphaerae]|uniref:glycosyltransferase family 2 protein n=1 Tax=Pseudothauera rhizosphaerae TaxID=2565932 RepID=UPI001E62483A|nr:glycosyltransferase family 2 protein [Pseudothauera rhizosphaerae]